MSDNALRGEELKKLTKYPLLESISFGGNHVKTMEELQPLTSLSKLTQLDLYNNPLSAKGGSSYRADTFKLFPGLKVLDLKDIHGNEYLGDDEDDGDEEDDESYDDNDQFIDNDGAANKRVKVDKAGQEEEEDLEDEDGDEEGDDDGDEEGVERNDGSSDDN